MDEPRDDTHDQRPEGELPADEHEDPRLQHVHGNQGMPGEVIDSPHNMPGDQPLEDDPPTVSEVHGRD